MKNLFLLIAHLFMVFVNAQTAGINTTYPKALLDIPASNSALPYLQDGLLPVRIFSFPLSNPSNDQNSLWTYHTTNRQNYWWDNSLGLFESFRNTLDQAYDNNGFGQGRYIMADTGALSVTGDGLYVTGNFGSGNNINLVGGGDTNLIFLPKTGSFIKSDLLVNTTTTEYDYNVIFGDGYNSAQYGAQYATIFGHYTSENADYAVCLGKSITLSPSAVCMGSSGVSFLGSSSIAIGNSYTTWSYMNAIGQNNGTRTGLTIIGNNNVAVSTLAVGYFIGIGNNNIGSFSGNIYSRHYFMGFNNNFSNGRSFVIGNDNSVESGLAIGHHLVSNSKDQICIGFYNTSYVPDPEPTNGQQPDNRLLVFGNGTASQRSDALVMLEDGRTGIGTSYPKVRLQINGGFSTQPESYTVVSNQQTITVGNKTYLRINSNNTPNVRQIVLDEGLAYGQLLIIECTAQGGNGIRIVDGSNTVLSSGYIDLYNDDTITLLYRSSWHQMGYSNN